jgi:hypothetical protein
LRLLKNAYTSPENDYLTEDQITNAAAEVLPLLQRFGWLETTTSKIGARILSEADLFTSAANGNAQLDVAEGVRYLALVLSSLRSAQEILALSDRECGGREAKCLRSLIEKRSAEAFLSMPNFQRAKQTWKSDRFETYMKSAETTCLDKVVDGDFAVSDLLTVIQIFQYVETFYQLYDRDGSAAIRLNEGLVALPIYGPTLNRLIAAGSLSSFEVSALFTFMMKYGDTPLMFGGQILFAHWKWRPNTWAFEAERDTLMSILSQLATLQK